MRPGWRARIGLLGVDLGRDDPQARAAMRRFRVVGLPTIVWIDADGQPAGSTVGFVGRRQLLDQLRPLEGLAAGRRPE